ncbi:MAG: hypothetical protein AABZ02_02450 [Bacteroidota bacterium]
MMNQRGRVCQRNFRPFVAALSLAMALTGQTFGQTVVPSDREGLLKGLGMGLASYAEENGYPGPKHVLELKDELGLTQDQLKKTEALQKMVAISAAAKGQQIVQAEEELNELFEAGTINGKVLRSKLGQIGNLRADLQFIHTSGAPPHEASSHCGSNWTVQKVERA